MSQVEVFEGQNNEVPVLSPLAKKANISQFRWKKIWKSSTAKRPSQAF